MQQDELNNRHRNFGLDLVRAVAIVLVLLSHGTLLMADLLSETNRRLVLYLGGYFGVELFFVLSGFLIGGLLITLFSDAESKALWPKICNFWRRRWFRTLPNYYLFLLLNVTLFHYWFGTAEMDWRHLLFLQNLAWPGSSLMPESWSLAVEEWFYLTIPMLLVGVHTFCGANGRRTVLYGMCGYIVLFTLLRGWVAFEPSVQWDEGIRKVVILRLDAVAWGGLLAWLMRFKSDFMTKNRHAHAFMGAVLVVISVFWVHSGVTDTFDTYWHKTLLFTFTSAGVAMLIPWFYSMDRGPRQWPLVTQSITRISLYSYSIYLVHFSFVLPLLQTWPITRNLPPLLLLTLYLVLSIGVAALVYHFFEKPIIDMRDKVSPRGHYPRRL